MSQVIDVVTDDLKWTHKFYFARV